MLCEPNYFDHIIIGWHIREQGHVSWLGWSGGLWTRVGQHNIVLDASPSHHTSFLEQLVSGGVATVKVILTPVHILWSVHPAKTFQGWKTATITNTRSVVIPPSLANFIYFHIQGVPKKALQFLSIRAQSRCDPDPDPDHIWLIQIQINPF